MISTRVKQDKSFIISTQEFYDPIIKTVPETGTKT